jgi:CTP synthase|tara:strand:+ start:632 stop:2254 length:1623 start_codon:yes stop_codon:yes gene_type:complete
MSNSRYIFVTGGVVSSLGKGISAAALGALLQARGYSVRIRKLDPYINVDPGTMSPYQHGEVFVTDDGAETDLDLGHYERFTGVPAKQSDNITTGRIYQNVINKEREGKYLGSTVQVIPHVTDEIKSFITKDIGKTDFIIVEIGGTVGDIESLPFLEAIRQFGNEVGKKKAIYIHLTLVPYISTSNELKTKPTQHSVKELREIGIQPNILLCRCDRSIESNQIDKIALFCNVSSEDVIQALDVSNIYSVPIVYHKEKLDIQVLKHFSIKPKSINLLKWKNIVESAKKVKKSVNVGIVGKYTDLPDAYKSLYEALVHGAIANNIGINIKWINSEKLKKNNINKEFKDINSIIVPGGFGERGIEGKINAIKFARINKIPFLGICLGLQLSVIEFTRNVLKLKDANSTEFANTDNNVIGLLTEWYREGKKEIRSKKSDVGGTMRLGSYPCKIQNNTIAYRIYKSSNINERHRHRYEVNSEYEDKLRLKGLIFSGKSPDGSLPEIIELKTHPWFLGVQFHPELKSRPFKPHPIFISFIEATKKTK